MFWLMQQGRELFGLSFPFLYRMVSSVFSIWIVGSVCKFPSRTNWEFVFFPTAVCVSFPVASLLRMGYCLSHILVVVFAFTFWAVVGCYGVVLSTIGPRMTQELFSLPKP